MSKQTTIINIQSAQPTYTALGLGPIPAGTTADAVVKTIQKTLIANLTTSWPSSAPAIVPSQTDQGLMGPWNDNIAGQAPACLTDQISMDFTNWELPNDSGTVNSMACEITQQISNNGGLSGQFYGRSRIGGSETVYWAVGFGTGAIVDNPEEMGIIYVFTAVLGLN